MTTVPTTSIFPESVAAARAEFSKGIYLEHLEEASFLYEQRLFLLDDPELTWCDLLDYEDRFDAHVEALVTGGELAITVCKEQALEGDAGELHTAVRVFCRKTRFDLLSEVVNAKNHDDEYIVTAVRNALADDLPDSWKDILSKLFVDKHPFFRKIVPYIAAYRRIDFTDIFLEQLPSAPAEELPAIIFALGRTGTGKQNKVLFDYLRSSEDERILAESARALLRHHHPDCCSLIKEKAQHAAWAPVFLGVCGSRFDVGLLHRIAATQCTTDAILAIGFLGCSVSVNTLIRFLEQQELAEAASYALYLITGAPLFEEVQIPDVDDTLESEDVTEDSVDSLETPAADSKNDDSPLSTPPNKSPEGITIKQIARNIERWTAWWKEHEAAFSIDVRYRIGKPFDLHSIVDTLTSVFFPRTIRQLAYEELAIRYRINVPFETEMTVFWQKYSIEFLIQKIEAAKNRFETGEWYFCGKIATV